jgi:DOPA 4,5-dioxygenase
MRDTTEITGYHAHVYFDPETRDAAELVRSALVERFVVDPVSWPERPVGPHTKAMYQLSFTPDQFAEVVPWLMLNRGELSILVHPNTADVVADHEANPLWLGERLPVDGAFLRRVARTRA